MQGATEQQRAHVGNHMDRARALLATGEIECDEVPGQVATIPVWDGRSATFVSGDGYRTLIARDRASRVPGQFARAFLAAGR
ncbi:MAG: hypothetical protein AB1941_01840 [Gemmatimonadota bacterium]